MTRRLDAGPLIAMLGAILLLVSLFLAWYEPSTEAWDAFEISDLLLTGIAIAAVLTAASLLADLPGRFDPRWLPWLAAGALLLVANALLSPPPTIDEDPATGLWLALAGAALLAAGTLLVLAKVSITFDVSARERRQRVTAVDARTTTEKTEPLP
jgi:H+/Cl- antiporter ClcA